MLLKSSIQKTKTFFHKTLLALKSFFFGGYKNLPKTLVLNPLSCTNNDPDSSHSGHIFTDFPIRWEPDRQEKTSMIKERTEEASRNDANYQSGRSVRISDEATVKKKKETRRNEVRRGGPSSNHYRGGSFLLAEKMKELEMMDMSDVDHSLDVEEALHYYSRLTCPVYLEIVDKFFMDMYAEFLVPQPPVSLNSSSRRLNSSRRLGPLVL